MQSLFRLLILLLLVGCEYPQPIPVDPNPPGPTPNPVVQAGFRVIIVYESSQNHTQEQLNALNSTRIIEFLNKTCERVDNHPEWRLWDKSEIDSSDLADETPSMRALWNTTKSTNQALPYMVIAFKNKVEVISLNSEEEVFSILSKKITNGSH